MINIKVANLGMKDKSETMPDVIRGLVLDFVHYFDFVPFICNFSTEYNIRYNYTSFDAY